MRGIRLRCLTLICGACLSLAAPGYANTILDSLGSAGQFTVFSLASTFQNDSNVTINGNVGVGPHGTASVMAPTTINGTVYKDTTANVSGPGNVTGGIVTMSLSQAVTDAMNASNTFASLAATQNFTSFNSAVTITGNGSTNVIDLSGGITLGGTNNITLVGGANDKFVFNISGGLALDGSSKVVLSGGVIAQNVVFNFIGTGTSLQTHIGNLMQGIVLAPNRNITFHGTFGEIIGGGSNLTLMSGAIVTGFQRVPDSGKTVVLTGISLVALMLTRVLTGKLRRGA